MALLVHFFDALSQFAFGKLAYAGAKHLFVFREGCQRTRACFFDGNLTLTHCVTLPAGSLWILNRHHNQRAVQKAKPHRRWHRLQSVIFGMGSQTEVCATYFHPVVVLILPGTVVPLVSHAQDARTTIN